MHTYNFRRLGQTVALGAYVALGIVVALSGQEVWRVILLVAIGLVLVVWANIEKTDETIMGFPVYVDHDSPAGGVKFGLPKHTVVTLAEPVSSEAFAAAKVGHQSTEELRVLRSIAEGCTYSHLFPTASLDALKIEAALRDRQEVYGIYSEVYGCWLKSGHNDQFVTFPQRRLTQAHLDDPFSLLPEKGQWTVYLFDENGQPVDERLMDSEGR